LTQEPCLDSHLAIDDSSHQPAKDDASAYDPPLFYIEEPKKPTEVAFNLEGAADPESAALVSLPEVPGPTVEGRFLNFTNDKLHTLKVLATDPHDETAWVSTFTALAVHLLQRLYLARSKLAHDTEASDTIEDPNFLTPVNLRTKLNLPERYPFNALFTPSTTFAEADFTSQPLHKIANVLHELTRSSDLAPESIKSSLQWMNAQSSLLDISTHFRYSPSSLMLSQWNKFNIYSSARMDVEPLLVQNPFTSISKIDGLGHTLPSRNADGGIVLALALDERVWKILDQDEAFL
jgi:hypothetical protein